MQSLFCAKPALMLPALMLIPCAMLLASYVATLAASPQCAALAEVMRGLSARYGEARVWSGVLPNGQLLSITANPDGSSWTALAVQPDGMACLVSSGESWVQGGPALPPAGQEG